MTTSARTNIVTVPVAELPWLHGMYTVTCPWCGSTGPWTLYRYDVERGDPDAPELERHAEAVCGPCERPMTHPLVYPEFVDAVADWTAAGLTPQTQPDAIADWRPHYLQLPPPSPYDLDGFYVRPGTWRSWDGLADHVRHERWPALARVGAAWATATTEAGLAGQRIPVPPEVAATARHLLTTV